MINVPISVDNPKRIEWMNQMGFEEGRVFTLEAFAERSQLSIASARVITDAMLNAGLIEPLMQLYRVRVDFQFVQASTFIERSPLTDGDMKAIQRLADELGDES